MCLMLVGCTHAQLTASTSRAAGTVMEIQYQVVMDNLARMERYPATLPSQIRIKQGTVQVSDEVGFYQLQVSGGAGGMFGGPRAERTVSEQWGADAICDPLAVKQLQDIYRAAMRLPPFHDPGFLDFAQARVSRQKRSGHGSGAPPGDAVTKVDLARDVPSDWFHVGTRSQMPSDAAYFGHFDGTWVWVVPDEVGDLSRFTLLVLFVTKLGPGQDTSTGGGLMYTGGR
ncbi:hypothetical protein HN018_23935 (plasmid) [Lichenicola cladoniae]|uniref:Uncharacterized protein n=1 Tax=Lichenicola cladoniae TaxID=1484109 RepID=A0A6M8HXG3_9PROT|nr:hypothetical protein [Lichenicola cladoniae]NPD69813.1 hypothetical protein [Acetobacteraceae bacterium]QKE93229.1 hypothetical protein HN018_23935 [Lichenicola cladoniae]